MHRACPVCERSNQSMVRVRVVVAVMDAVTESAPRQGDGVGSLGRIGNGGTTTRTAAASSHGEAGGGQDDDPGRGTELARVAAQESSQQQPREGNFGGKPVGGLAGPRTATDAVATEGAERVEAGLGRDQSWRNNRTALASKVRAVVTAVVPATAREPWPLLSVVVNE